MWSNGLSMTKPKDDAKHHEPEPTAAAGKPMCGLVMPISAMDGYLASHWAEVKAIITETLLDWEVRLVSDADGAGVIQRRIIENLYSDPFVIVDVSGRNPNVMFELGMRLAFDKPTLVIKDSDTPYPFDIAPNEYVEYPRNLRFHGVVEFKKKLAAKVEATIKPEHRTFLKDFGHILVPQIEKKAVPAEQLILDRLERMERMISNANADRNTEMNALGVAPAWAAHPRPSRVLSGMELRSHLVRLGVPKPAMTTALSEVVKSIGPMVTASEIDKWWADYGQDAYGSTADKS